MLNWKKRKEMHDRRICEHKTKKGNVYETKAKAMEESLLRAIFGDGDTESYQCSVCKKWHHKK